jgi:tRNA-specific 2-thiouridylase
VTVSLGDSFYRHVIAPFITTYIAGKTPNPCVICNREIKFGALPAIARDMGFPLLATGHYARIERDTNGRFLLKKAVDSSKDQSYFLWSLTQSTLSSIRFPLGTYQKSEIREIAAANGFTNAHKSDSQDICFIPDGDYISFIASHSDHTFPVGSFVDVNGNILGNHAGIVRYTVGQRKGLGIALGQPMFVKTKDPLQNTVTLSTDGELFEDSLTASEVNWIACDAPTSAIRAEVKIRYRHTPAPATVEPISDGRVSVRFDTPQRAIAPGQSVVFYDGDTVIGGGIID